MKSATLYTKSVGEELMKGNSNRVGELDVGIAVLQILASQPDGRATFKKLKQDVPKYLNLSEEDHVKSTTRPNEEMWEQLIRNIQSHHGSIGNIIHEGYAVHIKSVGYQITDAGRLYLKNKGF